LDPKTAVIRFWSPVGVRRRPQRAMSAVASATAVVPAAAARPAAATAAGAAAVTAGAVVWQIW